MLCTAIENALPRRCTAAVAKIIPEAGEAGLTTAELCRQQGITEQTYYRWKAKYGGMDSGDAKKLRQLEDENRKLKHVVAGLTLDNRALKDVLSKNF
jgi:putative transposase